MKLGKKLRLTYTGLVIVAVAIVLVLVIENAQRDLKEKIGNDLQAVAKLEALSITEFINIRIAKIRFVSRNPVFRGKSTVAMSDYLADIKRADSAYEELVVMDLQGEIIATTNPEFLGSGTVERKTLIDNVSRQAAGGDIGNEPFFSFAIPADKEEMLSALIARPVVSQDKKMIRVLMARVLLEDLLQLQEYQEVQEIGGKQAYAIDSQSTMIISQEEKSQVFTPLVYLQNKPPFLEGRKQKNRGYTIFKTTKKGVILVGYADLPDLGKGQQSGWVVLSMAPKREVFAPAIRLRNKVIILGIMTVLIAWVLALFVAKGITRPIRKLVKVTDLIAKGELTQRANIKQNDEVGDLARSFNKMTDKLNDVIALRDQEILDRKNVEEQLKEEMEEKTIFIDMISNEFRTPLTAIREGIKGVLAETSQKLDERQIGILELAKRSGESLSGLVHDIMEYHQLSEAMEELDLQGNDINEIIKEVHAEMLPLLAEKRDIKFLMNLEDSIPSASFDKDRIKLVVANLINSSIFFAEQGSITVSTGREGENAIKVTVKDTGTFISEEDLPKLFDRYEDAGKLRDKRAGGTGLGLSISKKIIDRHNGKIWVESGKDTGTVFYFILPIEERRTRK